MRRRYSVRGAGALTSENPGMSNERKVRILSAEISKVSAATLFVCGLVDPKVSLFWGVADGQPVNIPVLRLVRYQLGRDNEWEEGSRKVIAAFKCVARRGW